MSVHGAWQIAATGRPCVKKSRTNDTAFSSIRRKSGLATPPGSTRAPKEPADVSPTTSCTGKVSALSRWLNAWILPGSVETSTGSCPAFTAAFHGSVSSICSTPSGAVRNAMRM
ncbi:hypothetical protein RKD19_001661 [Streptomyces canus]